MNVNTYLRYNNIALVDPQVGFHASCIKQFNEKGYLSTKQLEHLRGWNHSPEAIMRLTAGLDDRYTVVEEPVGCTTAINKSKWSDTELTELFALVNAQNGAIELDTLAKALNRTASAVQGTLYKHSECAIKRGKVIYCVPKSTEEVPF